MNERELVREDGPIDEEAVDHADQAHDLHVGRILVVERQLNGCFVCDTEDSNPEEVDCDVFCIYLFVQRLICSKACQDECSCGKGETDYQNEESLRLYTFLRYHV